MDDDPITFVGYKSGRKDVAFEERRRQCPIGERFTFMFHEKLYALLPLLKGSVTVKVMIALLNELDYEHFRRVNQTKLAKYLQAHQSQISGAMNQLHEVGFLARQGRGPMTEWALEHHYSWRGSGWALQRAKRRYAKDLALGKARTLPPIVAEGILRNRSRNKKRSERRQVEVLTGHAATEDNGNVRLGAIVRNRL